eukprot:Protomagalhaensia_sp_Gyna_25__2324@NODE_227_length_4270_cov_139_711652_g177_i0_p3_GENE_NODE_227_length_4270_cov_139_711652_g177_i0NODE_227_length_4270_cov_139_711652_g177_i0_p3_ORF_typecomplete_len375_score49_86Glyco_transf_43/PF03360_16/1_7e25_NODE_227_length_4270_cov_139_711652_g177_i029094033
MDDDRFFPFYLLGESARIVFLFEMWWMQKTLFRVFNVPSTLMAVVLAFCVLLPFVLIRDRVNILPALREYPVMGLAVFANEPVGRHIYLITPTYSTTARELHLLRLLPLIAVQPRLTWLIVEDAEEVDSHVQMALERTLEAVQDNLQLSGERGFELIYTHVGARREGSDCRGLEGRFRGVEIVFDHVQRGKWPQGVMVFLDDDNVYNINIFSEMRNTERLGIWAGAHFDFGYFNFPIESSDGIVKDTYDSYTPRKFPIDMGNFVFNTEYVLSRLPVDNPAQHWKPHECPPAQLESLMLERLGLDDWTTFTALNNHGSKVGFWHTRTLHNAYSCSMASALMDQVSSTPLKAQFERVLHSFLLPKNKDRVRTRHVH